MNRRLAYLVSTALLIGVVEPTSAHAGLATSVGHLPIDRIGPITSRLAADAEKHRLQLLTTTVTPAPGGPSRVRTMGYRVDAEYFYPASSIKLCAAVGALEFIEDLANEHDAPDLISAALHIGDPHGPVDARPAFGVDAAVKSTLSLELRKLAVVSDNDAFNNLFDLVSPDELNRRMHRLGLSSVVISHRLAQVRSALPSNTTRPITLRPPDVEEIRLPSRTTRLDLTNQAPRLRVGNAYLRGDERVPTPMDFSRRNGISLRDLHQLLIQLARPDLRFHRVQRSLNLSPEHRRSLLNSMSIYPRESADPRYDAVTYPDDYAKFLLPGIRRVFPDREPGTRIEIINKIGRAYGFSVENAWLRNPANGREVFVTAVVYTNEDGVLNDDRYEYETVADPFFAELGEWIARRFLSGP